jgi:uncharacterized protein (DUF1800 family)
MPARFVGMLAACLLAVCLPVMRASGADPVSDRSILHVLNRLAFGPTLEDFRRVKAIGVERYIAEQLDPDNIPESYELRWRLAALNTLGLNAVQLREIYGPLRPLRGFKPSDELVRAQRERLRIVVQQAAEARILRAVLSRRQLQEVMVDFWYNHFNVFAGKELDDLWIGDYEQRAIRPFVLGQFRDLLFAVTKHPAMLVYLDNTLSTAPKSLDAKGSRAGLNENFARELMELHTLGTDGGYTEEDVVTLARVLTGWSLNRPDAREYPDYATVFEGARHDFGAKVFLGQPLRSKGKAEGEEALDMLAKSPATARHIAFELAQYFVADSPPSALVDRLAERFAASDGNIREVLKVLFDGREFWESGGLKYKTPYQFVLSLVRAGGIAVGNTRPMLAAINQLGMPLYGCLTPDGYKNTEDAWLSPDATTRRISIATAFARGEVAVTSMPFSAVPSLSADRPRPAPVDAGRLSEIFDAAMTSELRETLATAPPGLRGALILGSPEFMRR